MLSNAYGWVVAFGVWTVTVSGTVSATDAPSGLGTDAEGAALHLVTCPYPPGEVEAKTTCGQARATCLGTDGRDLIIGTSGDDVIVAGSGNDVVIGNGGDDLVCGGAGNDALLGSVGKDTLIGGEGNDWLFGARGDDLLDGGPGDFDVLWGGPGVDRLDGGAGDHDVCLLQRDMGEASLEGCNTIYPPPGYQHDEGHTPGIFDPGEGSDVAHRPAARIITCPWIPEGIAEVPTCGGKAVTCMGTDANDLIYGTGADDVIWAGPGNDVVHADDGDDTVCGGPGMDALMGAGGDDALYGDEGDDWLFGAIGDDALYGGAGEDVIWSAPGEDRLDGGEGAFDVCIVHGCRRAGSASKADPATCETIYQPARR